MVIPIAIRTLGLKNSGQYLAAQMELEYSVIYGKHAVEELFESQKPIAKVFIHNRLSGPFEIQVREICKERNIPLVRTEIEYLNRFSGGRNHQGIIATTSPIEFQDLEVIIPHLYENDRSPLFVILDHIKDVRNFGAIARSAEVFGANAIIIPRKNSAAINNDAVKTSSGALLHIPVCRVSDIKDTIQLLQNNGIQVFASTLFTEKMIGEMDFKGPAAVILGAEGKGVQKELVLASDHSFKIPQHGKTDSLNVSVSAGIMLYEIIRQRG